MDFGFAGCLPEAAPCLGMVGWAKSATNDTSVVRSAAVMNESNSVDSVAGSGTGPGFALLCERRCSATRACQMGGPQRQCRHSARRAKPIMHRTCACGAASVEWHGCMLQDRFDLPCICVSEQLSKLSAANASDAVIARFEIDVRRRIDRSTSSVPLLREPLRAAVCRGTSRSLLGTTLRADRRAAARARRSPAVRVVAGGRAPCGRDERALARGEPAQHAPQPSGHVSTHACLDPDRRLACDSLAGVGVCGQRAGELFAQY